MAAPARAGLNARQQRFVAEYLVDLNATQAAIRAGYSARTAGAMGYDLLKKPEIEAALQEARESRAERTEVDQDNVVQELAAVAFSDIGDLFDFAGDSLRMKSPKQISARARKALSSMKVRRVTEGQGKDAREVEIIEFKLWPKDRALEMLGRHLAMFTDRLQVSDLEGLSDEELEARIAELQAKAVPQGAGTGER